MKVVNGLMTFLVLLCSQLCFAAPENIRITTFNIRFYGLGGSLEGSPQKEHRDATLKSFLKEQVPQSQVMVFQEIVDPERLKNNVLPAGWTCLTYDHPEATHQHVVLCHSSDYQFVRDRADDNDLIDDVAFPSPRLRPAVTSILTDKQGNPLLRVIGVHLKAQPNESRTRIEQAKRIATYLRGVSNPELPIAIMGDFNTFPKGRNGQNKGDVELITEAFQAEGLDLVHLDHGQFTFRKKDLRSQLDHFWVSSSLMNNTTPQVIGVCNQKNVQKKLGRDITDPDFYYNNISDHCPLTIKVNARE